MLKTEINRVGQIREKVMNLGSIVININEKILNALESKEVLSVAEIKQLPKRDILNNVDTLDNEIVTALSLHCPEARDLREMVSFLKISNELLRVYSNSRSFINGFSDSFSVGLKEKKILQYVIPLQRTTLSCLKGAIDMIVLEDKEQVKSAFQLVYTDEVKTDELYQVLTKEIMGLINKNESKSLEYYEVLNVVRRVEKVADRALSIASLVYYAKLGGEISQDIEVD